MESLALWCGLAGLISSILAVIILFLTRKNIVDIIDKDIILFERNFDIKKDAITNAFNLVDEIGMRGKQITLTPEFAQKAKKCHNDLMCVVSKTAVAEEFNKIAINPNYNVTEFEIEQFKILCRRDIGFRAKKLKKPENKQFNNYVNSQQISYSQPVQPVQPVQPAQPVQSTQPTQPQPVQQPQTMNTQQAVSNPRPVQQTQPTQPRPIQTTQPIRRAGRPKKED